MYWRAYALKAAKGIGLRGDDAEDAAQEALCDLLAAWAKPTGDPKGYYVRVVRNAVRRHRRDSRANINDWLGLGDYEMSAPDLYEAAERKIDAALELRQIADLIDSLTEAERNILRLTSEGYTDAEIGARLSRCVGGISDARYKAHRKLRQAA